MHLKVHGGTVQHGGESLCTTCRFATIVRGPSLRDEIVECSRLSEGHNRIRFRVRTCSVYSDRRQPSIHDMEDIAWCCERRPIEAGSVSSRHAT